MSNPTRYDQRVTEDGAGLYATDEPNTRGMQYVSALDYDALLAERDAAQKDAERYRWLRMSDWWDSPLCVVRNPARQVQPGSDCPSRDRLDAAIDAALQGEQP